MTADNARYDVIIVGTRVGGAILGSLLGEKGYTVLALDRTHFPSDTLSTHFFRAPALRAFLAIGVEEEVSAIAPHLIVNYNAIDGIVFPEPVDRPEDFPFFMNVRRITLDDILVRRLKGKSSVKVIEGAIVHTLVNEGGRVAGLAWKDETGMHEARARVVVGADGVHSFVAKTVLAQTEHVQVAQRAMYYSYFTGVEPHDGPAAEFHYRGNQIAYLMPTDGHLTLLAVSVPIARFGEFKRDPEGSLMRELGLMSDMAPRLAKAQRQFPVQGSGSIPCYMRIPFGPGWVLVGDAGMVMDPWSGQGIDQASTHAVLLAEHLETYLSGKLDWVDALTNYHRARNVFSQKAYRRTSNFASDLRPMTQAALAKRGLK